MEPDPVNTGEGKRWNDFMPLIATIWQSTSKAIVGEYMEVLVNNQSVKIEEALSLIGLMQKLDMQRHSGIAIAVNNTIVPKDQWESHMLSDADVITLITATQGG